MASPNVSVIIPTYRGADYLGATVQSVLDQTYPHFELIVVNDASPDHTSELMQQFDEPRLLYCVHDTNQGAVAARATGLASATGEFIAFLDQDDLFHPEKLEAHVTFLMNHPEVGVSYNGRYEINGETQAIREIWQPPLAVTLEDMLVSFPFAPSDTVFRRKWAFHEGVWDYATFKGDEVIVNGAEYIYCGRLYFAGCTFAGIGRALNYRRYHPGRVYSDLERRCRSEHMCQDLIFDDDRCPTAVRAAHGLAHTNTNLVWAYYAFAQNETRLGQMFLLQAVELQPEILAGNPCRLLDFLVMNSIAEEGREHPDLLQSIFAQLPQQLNGLSEHLDWAIGLGHLLIGSRAIMWGQYASGQYHLARARARQAAVDQTFVQKLTYQLLLYERECGAATAQAYLETLLPYLDEMGDRSGARALKANYSIGQAFRSYERQDFREVPRAVIQALRSDPKYAANRGVWSILLRSLTSVS